MMFIPALINISCWHQTNSSSQRNYSSSIKVSSNFDAGSIDTLWESTPDFLTGWPKHWKHKSSGDDQYYWFYFKLDNVGKKDITIRLDSLVGVYRGGPHLIYTEETQPVYSYDQEKWFRIENVKYDSTNHSLTFRNLFTEDSVWIAYAHPFPYQYGLELINAISGHSFLNIEKLGSTREARDINLLTITDPQVPDNQKKVVFITTLQHAGESNGGYVVSGLVNFLLSNDENAALARKAVIYKVIPMMNPDGIFHGMTRLNGNLEDLNQEWDDDFADTSNLPVEPEVACVKKWIREWLASGHKIDMGLDVHSQGQEGTRNLLHTPKNVLADFTPFLNKYWPVEYIPMQFSGSLNDCLVREFNIAAGTFEIPQSRIGNNKYLTIDNYYSYGKGTALAIRDYFLERR